MMQALGESIFDVLYLSFVLVTGIQLLRARTSPLVTRAGLMAVLLGGGDAFHLIPRMWALWTTGLEANAALLGAGKAITSVTMTVFYVLLYFIWREYYGMGKQKPLTWTMLGLAALRMALCLLPQNQWLSAQPPLSYGIARNLPFAAMGVIIIVLFARQARRAGDGVFRYMPLAVALSFGFYAPVVLFSATAPAVGMLMIPKTLAYVWVVVMCKKLYRKDQKGDRRQ